MLTGDDVRLNRHAGAQRMRIGLAADEVALQTDDGLIVEGAFRIGGRRCGDPLQAARNGSIGGVRVTLHFHGDGLPRLGVTDIAR